MIILKISLQFLFYVAALIQIVLTFKWHDKHTAIHKKILKYLYFVLPAILIINIFLIYFDHQREVKEKKELREILNPISNFAKQKFGEKDEKIALDKLLNEVDKLSNETKELKELLGPITKYAKRKFNETDEKKAIDKLLNEMNKLKNEVDNLSVVAPKLRPDGRIAASPGVSFASEFSNGINKSRKLFNDGKFEEAYQAAKSLLDKNPNFGLSFFIMGTIEIQKNNYLVGDDFLKKAIELTLPKDDEAWAYHNLAISSLRQNNVQEAIPLLKNALVANPNMSESKVLLEKIENSMTGVRP